MLVINICYVCQTYCEFDAITQEVSIVLYQRH